MLRESVGDGTARAAMALPAMRVPASILPSSLKPLLDMCAFLNPTRLPTGRNNDAKSLAFLAEIEIARHRCVLVFRKAPAVAELARTRQLGQQRFPAPELGQLPGPQPHDPHPTDSSPNHQPYRNHCRRLRRPSGQPRNRESRPRCQRR